MNSPSIPSVLAVAASDSSGAAGMQADLKTFEARQVYGLSVLTAVTAQNSHGVQSVVPLAAEFVSAQFDALFADITPNAVKTGMLLKAELIERVHGALAAVTMPVIVDPVLVAGNGKPFIDAQGITAYREWLFPRALIITPNLDEAAILTGQPVHDPATMREAAKRLHAMGPRYVLIKGGHLQDTDVIVDILYDGTHFYEYAAPLLPVRNPRGTGCTFAACITAEVAKGVSVTEAVGTAKGYLHAALKAALDWQIGTGRGTLFHGVGRLPLTIPTGESAPNET